MPQISIIIATYNSEKHIAGAIENVLSSEFDDFELIIVNDGSTDKTSRIVHEYTAKDSRIMLIEQQNTGPGGARNTGLAAARGEYVLMIDDDDALGEKALLQYSLAAEKNPDIVIGGYIMRQNGAETLFCTDDISGYTHSAFLSLMPDIIDAHLGYITWNKLYKKSVIDDNNIRFTDYKSCEDRLFNIEFYRCVQKFIIISNPLYVYTLHESSGLNNKFLPDRKASLDDFYNSIHALYDDGCPKRAESVFANAYIKGVYALIISTRHQSCALSKKQKRAYVKAAVCGENARAAVKSAKPGLKMLLPVLCIKSKCVLLCTLCARLISFADDNLHLLFMKLKHGK